MLRGEFGHIRQHLLLAGKALPLEKQCSLSSPSHQFKNQLSPWISILDPHLSYCSLWQEQPFSLTDSLSFVFSDKILFRLSYQEARIASMHILPHYHWYIITESKELGTKMHRLHSVQHNVSHPTVNALNCSYGLYSRGACCFSLVIKEVYVSQLRCTQDEFHSKGVAVSGREHLPLLLVSLAYGGTCTIQPQDQCFARLCLTLVSLDAICMQQVLAY